MNRPPLQTASTDGDLLPVVDENDQPVGVRTRREVHTLGLRHRAVHIFVLDPAGRLWLQKRGRHKDTYPLYWDLSATGHVDPGESYQQAAVRELREELGIAANPRFIAKLPATERSGWEFHALFWMVWPEPVTAFDRHEIEEVQAVELARLDHLIAAPDPQWPLAPGVADGLGYLRQVLERHAKAEDACDGGRIQREINHEPHEKHEP